MIAGNRLIASVPPFSITCMMGLDERGTRWQRITFSMCPFPRSVSTVSNIGRT